MLPLVSYNPVNSVPDVKLLAILRVRPMVSVRLLQIQIQAVLVNMDGLVPHAILVSLGSLDRNAKVGWKFWTGPTDHPTALTFAPCTKLALATAQYVMMDIPGPALV